MNPLRSRSGATKVAMMKVEAGDFEQHKVIKQWEPDDLEFVDFEMT
jgi:hypothetical protein